MKNINKTQTKAAVLATIIAISISLGGCIKTTRLAGYTYENKKTEGLIAGDTRKAVVKRELGSPSAVSNYGDETWYYISTEYESIAFFKPKIKSQNILAIKFNSDESIKEIQKYTENDAQSIKLSKEVTKTEGNDVGVVGQLLGNVGRFNTDSKDVTKPKSQP
jgi:outer membrane protein assembly factor BamE (lipoprotein component of BamABCDE complex)